MQRRIYKDMPKRTRYYRGMIDFNMIEKGKKYSELKKTIIIFICQSDPYGEQMYRYTFANRCKEIPELLMGDETEIVFLNIKGKRGEVSEELKNLLKYLNEELLKEKGVEYPFSN